MFRTLYWFFGAIVVLMFLIQISCTRIVRERDLFAPQHYPSMADSLQRQNVEIPVNKLMVLRGWYLTSRDYHRSLIYFYGNGESVVTVSPLLYWLSSTFKLNVLAVDYRGYGFSDGKPGLEGMSSDALRIYDYLKNNLVQEGAPIVIYGRSLGTAFAVKVALQRPVTGVILQSPPTAITDVIKAWQKIVPWFFRWFIRLKPEKRLLDMHPQPIEEIQALSVPLLVIHGTEDKLIPIKFGRIMYDNAGSVQKQWCEIEGSGHNDIHVFKGAAMNCLNTFFNRTISQPP